MPHLLTRGITVLQLCQISTALVNELATLCNCETDNFILEANQTTSIANGEVVPSYPFIEVAWFDRGSETRDQFAQIITKHVLSLGIAEVEIVFITYDAKCYYANGRAFSDH